MTPARCRPPAPGVVSSWSGAASRASPRLSTRVGELNLISTITVFGTPTDITLSELALETFFPADEPTAAALRRVADQAQTLG